MEPQARLGQSFGALVVDWEASGAPSWVAGADEVRRRLETLCAVGVHVFVVSDDDVAAVDARLRARPNGRGKLHLCCNRGSEVFEATRRGLTPVFRRQATRHEEGVLQRAAALTVEVLTERGFEARVAARRLNRRRVDFLPPADSGDLRGMGDAPPPGTIEGVRPATPVTSATEVVVLAAKAADAAGLAGARITGSSGHVEIGLTDKSDAAHFAARWLVEQGITGQLVLLVGGEASPTGPNHDGGSPIAACGALPRAAVASVGDHGDGAPSGAARLDGRAERLVALLDEQLERRAARRVPQIDVDPEWVLELPGSPSAERAAEALGALSNGYAGTRGAREDRGRGSVPLFAVAGLYTEESHLLHGPVWTDLECTPSGRGDPEALAARRLVDLRTGTLARFDDDDRLRSVRFVAASFPCTMALRAEAGSCRLTPGEPLGCPVPADTAFVESRRGSTLVTRTGQGERKITVAARDRSAARPGTQTVERVAAWTTGRGGRGAALRATRRLARASIAGFDALLAEHRAAWVRRWRDAEVVISGGPDAKADQLAARFAVFHLLSAAADHGEAAVGARGLTGDAYDGHVLWDADVFVLPALAAIRPSAARAMLEYRVNRLPAARAGAADRGLSGARFPWESAGDGSDVTPRLVHGAHGEPIVIRTGTHEEHIVADVAWAASRYAEWTGDDRFLSGGGRDLVLETARYWASRVRLDRSGRAHLYGVMGPDEYHEVVDDNAYTNAMARWNLERGTRLLEVSGRPHDIDEAARWRDLARRLVDGWDDARHLYEQFAGYFTLEPLLVNDVAHPPVAADVLLGRERVSRSQVIKQADVLMLYHLLPTTVPPGSLPAALDFYEPRTAHGSSLSPAISASLLARAGRPDSALELFRLAARLDIDDLTGTTAGGLHLATMGGLWQALAYGFLGLRAAPEGLVVDPHLPAAWAALSMRLRFRGERLTVRATHHGVSVSGDVQGHRPPRDVAPVRSIRTRHASPIPGPFPERPQETR